MDEVRLTGWMEERLRVAAVAVADSDRLGEVETAVLTQLDPPLNLRGMAVSPVRRQLSQLRGSAADHKG
ncbi:GIY-YIG nuclease family protein [Cellulomonas bogoriensis]|uniref:GIY-YIG nuclease family protein n=1 Tax=Cellulomonas bogoriensis TaxID=301388 RepID=UPI000A5DB57A|nr:hypothetical protein [Cellulomonas bogoriensis]